ncbi:hypothetical protein JYU02_00395 [bacterium AH-315-P15]|nr:hypothetical protein [bacterium AH-315-P15]
MGICSVLAIIPFLCSAPADEPPEDEEQVIEAQPAPEVAIGVLAPPPASRRVSDLQVLPPSRGAAIETPVQRRAQQGAETFSEWVDQNWGDERSVAAVPATPEPRFDLGVMDDRAYAADVAAEPSRELYGEPAPELYGGTGPALVRLEPPALPAYVQPEPARRSFVRPYRRERTSEPQVALNYTPRPDPGKIESAAVAASAGGAWDAAAALADGSISFAEPEVFTRRGQQVQADGIAARKQREMRRVERELRRLARNRGE